jgi:hypothetical protein
VVLMSCVGALGGCGSAPQQGAAPSPTSTSATTSTAADASTGASTAQSATAPPGATTSAAQPPGTAPPVVQPPTLAPRAKELIDAAKQARQESVVLTISAAPGRTDAVAQALRDLGATVESADATVGYLRASVPIAVAAQAATLAGVSRADVEEPIGFPDPTP